MDVTIREHGDEAFVTIIGRVDTNSADILKSNLDTLSPNIKTIIFDFAKVNYIASGGLRVLFATYKKQLALGGGVVISKPNASVMDVLSISGLSDAFICLPEGYPYFQE